MEQKRRVERDIEREYEKERGIENKMEREKNLEGSINGPSIRGRVGLTLKLDEFL